MNKLLLASILSSSFALTACSNFQLPFLKKQCDVSVAKVIQPILNQNCVACHQDLSAGGDLSLQRSSMLKNTVNVPSTGLPSMMRIQPGDANASFFYRKLVNTHAEAGGGGTQMPPGGSLAEEDIASIRTWIEACRAAPE